MLQPCETIEAYTLERQKILRNYFADLTEILNEEVIDTAIAEPPPEYVLRRPGAFRRPQWTSFRDYYQLLHQVQRTTHIPGFGLLIGAVKIPTDFGIYGYAMQSSETLGDFAAVAKRIFGAIYEGLELGVQIEHGALTFCYRTIHSAHAGYVPLMEQVVSTGVALISKLMPTALRWELCEARFAFEKPRYATLYEEHIPCRLRFNQEHTELRIPASWLGDPTVSGNQLVAEMCERQFKMMLDMQNPGISLSDKVRNIIHRCPDDIPCLGEVAEKCCVSERTLRQHLADEGTSFRDLVNEVRVQRAKKYLLHSCLSAKQIAYRLGYSHPQSFCRAFGKSVGVTPDGFRRQHN